MGEADRFPGQDRTSGPAATGGSGPPIPEPEPPPGQPAEDGLIAPRMSTTNTSVSVPLIPAWELPVFP